MFNYYAYAFIDVVQTLKKQAVETLVPHDKLKQSLNEFVDIQTKYTKDMVDNFAKTGSSVGSLLMDKKFYEEVYENVKLFPFVR